MAAGARMSPTDLDDLAISPSMEPRGHDTRKVGGGDRRLTGALTIVVLTRIPTDLATRDFVNRRTLPSASVRRFGLWCGSLASGVGR